MAENALRTAGEQHQATENELTATEKEVENLQFKYEAVDIQVRQYFKDYEDLDRQFKKYMKDHPAKTTPLNTTDYQPDDYPYGPDTSRGDLLNKAYQNRAQQPDQVPRSNEGAPDDPKFPDPQMFTGIRSEWEPWKHALMAKVYSAPGRFHNEDVKILYASVKIKGTPYELVKPRLNIIGTTKNP